jgi:hypothetical protein
MGVAGVQVRPASRELDTKTFASGTTCARRKKASIFLVACSSGPFGPGAFERFCSVAALATVLPAASTVGAAVVAGTDAAGAAGVGVGAGAVGKGG